ncbi:radical SAM protein [Mumia sp. zg.B17]|uniref:4Fe-4S single cluster domain-containing protein n=1 Tax=Mumia sp. zg.B17 TaxID=2855446 RepID=UPI001C6E629A|nr:4Fe-4S single cluster domain-containing protein [Mumia sp. zg.B17]MBW9205349.1 radical SAM protein [Mumia sp. zg.B17]
MSSTSSPVRVARSIPRTTAEGPGTRFALWVQGCTLQCPGCFNPHLWTQRGGDLVAPETLLDAVPADVEGVTLLGGEPFEQAGPLAVFAALVRQRGQSVMTFTGFTLDDLRRKESGDVDALIAQTDLLVDGPFLKDQVDLARPWVGSRNQRFHALGPRYRTLVDELDGIGDRLEIRVSADGTVSVNGWAPTATLDLILADLGRRQSRTRR